MDATEAEKANAVQVVHPTEVNELDRAAAAVPAESSWITYLQLILGAALAAACGHVDTDLALRVRNVGP